MVPSFWRSSALSWGVTVDKSPFRSLTVAYCSSTQGFPVVRFRSSSDNLFSSFGTFKRHVRKPLWRKQFLGGQHEERVNPTELANHVCGCDGGRRKRPARTNDRGY